MVDVGLYCTPKQLAERLGVSKQTILRAITAGHLEAVDLSSRPPGPGHRPIYRISPEAVDAYLQARIVLVA